MRKHVLTNIAMMRIRDSDLANVYADAIPSDESDIDVVVTLTVLDADRVQQVRALIPEAPVAVRQGGRANRM